MPRDMKIGSIAHEAAPDSEAGSSRRTDFAFAASAPLVRPSFEPRSYPLVGWATFAVVLAAWQLVAWRQADAILLPSPIDVASALYEMMGTGELQADLGASLGRLTVGWVIGAGLGALTGFAIGLYPIARSSVLPLVNALFAIPKIALLPVFIVWLGIGELSKVTTIAVGVFSPMAIAAYSGMDAVDRNLIRMAQSFSVPTLAILRKVILPGLLPSLLTGARISGAIAIVLLVGAEMIAAENGVGALALTSGGLMRTDRLFAAVAILGALGLTASWLVGLAERALLKWR